MYTQVIFFSKAKMSNFKKVLSSTRIFLRICWNFCSILWRNFPSICIKFAAKTTRIYPSRKGDILVNSLSPTPALMTQELPS
ncbi:MAG: hypothetical protein RL407_1441 [Bacteroidota bacterium]|jgi:hypothetical protein